MRHPGGAPGSGSRYPAVSSVAASSTARRSR
ncbi:hypothetical protein Ae505Ps2_3233c [Pseudonocardia sp. Ae505_Ps2]|nr:hypothetical protein Ae505Ps2_3233c [Pseudonocardia sp. Ae505_Ps2]